MKHTFETLNMSHVTTSCYYPKENSKVDQFHRTVHGIMSKKVGEYLETWDLHLNQILVAIKFSMHESTKFSTFYLLYNYDPVLPINNILKPCRGYLGEEPCKVDI